MSEQDFKPLADRDPDWAAPWIEQARRRLAALTDDELKELYLAVQATGGEQYFREIHPSNMKFEWSRPPEAGIHCAEFELVIGCAKQDVQPLLTILKFVWEVCGE